MKKAAIIFLTIILCLTFSFGALAADYAEYEVELAGNINCFFEAATAEYGTFTFSFVGEQKNYTKEALFITARPESLMMVYDRVRDEQSMKYGYLYFFNEEKAAYELADIGSLEIFTEYVDMYLLGWGADVLLELGEEEAMGGKTVFLKYGEGGSIPEEVTPEGTYFATGGYADFIFENAVFSDISMPIGTEYFGEYKITMQDATLISVDPESMIHVVVPNSTEPSNYYGHHYRLNEAGTAYEMSLTSGSIEFTSTLAWLYFDGMGEEGEFLYNLGTGIDGRPVYLTLMGWDVLTDSKPVSPQTPAAPSGGAEEIVLTIGSQTAIVDGAAKEIDVVPELVNGSTFVPVRFITETLGMAVNYVDGKTILTAEGKEIIITRGSLEASFNGEIKTLLAAPFIKDSRTMVPLRFISEATGYTVHYDSATKVITIK